jgi:hypothetical protein
MPPALLLATPIGKDSFPVQYNPMGMTGIHERVVPLGGAHTLTPKTMKRKSLKGLALSAPPPKQGSVYDDILDASDEGDVEAAAGLAALRAAEDQEREDESPQLPPKSRSYSTVQFPQLPKGSLSIGSNGLSSTSRIDALLDAPPARKGAGAKKKKAGRWVDIDNVEEDVRSRSSPSKASQGGKERDNCGEGSDMKREADADIVDFNHNSDDPQLPINSFEAPAYQPYNLNEEDRQENENFKKKSFMDDDDDKYLVAHPAMPKLSGLNKIKELCTHETRFGGLCVDCGREIANFEYFTHASLNLTHDIRAQLVGHNEGIRTRDDIEQLMLQEFTEDDEGLDAYKWFEGEAKEVKEPEEKLSYSKKLRQEIDDAMSRPRALRKKKGRRKYWNDNEVYIHTSTPMETPRVLSAQSSKDGSNSPSTPGLSALPSSAAPCSATYTYIGGTWESVHHPLIPTIENKLAPAVAAAPVIDEVDALLKEWTTVF